MHVQHIQQVQHFDHFGNFGHFWSFCHFFYFFKFFYIFSHHAKCNQNIDAAMHFSPIWKKVENCLLFVLTQMIHRPVGSEEEKEEKPLNKNHKI